jgi:hypothetical protein
VEVSSQLHDPAVSLEEWSLVSNGDWTGHTADQDVQVKKITDCSSIQTLVIQPSQ